ncbi:Meckelin [Hondaea fermentalgiana]|uniref:Meckelin n=1 Tax=Hondaea fermentalgiana TaxID=2315210 RepID=A0A2R5GAI5_9STRA|nr:Meckelin [Hondaea fermentalgiana]|eukprot:GBG28027.1 Meckelin [Hondaea fermentalgiana]
MTGPHWTQAFALALVVLVACFSETKSAEKSILLTDCAEDEYLDTSSFQCQTCASPPNIPLTTDGLDARIADYMSLISPFSSRSYTVAVGCRCAQGWITNADDLYTSAPCETTSALSSYWCDAFRCNECPEASTVDNTACTTCGPSSTSDPDAARISFNTETKQCECTDSSHVLRERDVNGNLLAYKRCEACPNGTLVRSLYLAARAEDGVEGDPAIVEADAYTCQPCPHPAMVIYNNRCVCALPSDNAPLWTQVGIEGIGSGVTCVLTSEMAYVNLQRYAEVEYTHVVPTTDPTSSARRALGATATPVPASSPVATAVALEDVNFDFDFDEAEDVGAAAAATAAGALRGRRELQTSSEDQGYTSYTVRSSAIFSHYFPLAGARCRYLRDAEGLQMCQALANLCVLQQYNDESPACELMADIHQNRDQWNEVTWDWRQLTPWLHYEDLAPTVLADTGIETEFSFDMQKKDGTVDYMQFVLARYSLNGTFLGWSNVTTEFEFCTPTQNQVPRWRHFGYGYGHTYACNLFNLMRYFPEPEFYDMYLVDVANSGRLYPVPVRNRNLVQNGAFPNENTEIAEEADDVLTRRFFLYDQVSSSVSASDEASVIRYAKTITLTTTVQELSSNKIEPPVLEILYEERLVADFYRDGVDEEGNPLEENTYVDLSFTVAYTEKYDSFWQSTAAFFGITMTIVGLFGLLRLYNWTRRNSRLPGDSPVDFVFLLRCVSYMLSTFSTVFFWFLFAYAAYIFIFFKMQDSVHLLLPVFREEYGKENDYYPFMIVLQLCFFGQLARMIEVVVVQSNVDIFFLDWEKPRGRVQSKRGDGTKTRFAPISVWRTIFMANEWNELQRVRKYDQNLAFLLLATILVAGDVQYAATPTPDFRDLTAGPLNMVLRFFNTSFWYILITTTQIIFKWAIQDRYITEPPTHSLIDLCTIAKVSIFVLDEEYHGYYLHCRSQHEFADGSMLEISRQLRQEEEGLTTDRGLPGCPERGLQSFEIYVTGEWKRQYNHIFSTMMNEEIQGAHADTTSFLLRVLRRKSGRPVAEKLVRASRKLSAFLRSFVDQDTSEFPIQHREQTFLHRFLHTPPEMMNSKDNIFFPDPFYQYDRVLLYGQTWNLILFNVLCITTCDLWWDDTTLSIFAAFLLDRFFVTIRELFGNANLSQKTLVDDRFLI